MHLQKGGKHVSEIIHLQLSSFHTSWEFSAFPAIESLPVDISILAMIIPALYFLFHTITKMRINKSFFMIVAFGFANTPNLLLQDNSLEKIIFFLLIFLVLTIVSPVILKSDESKTLFVKYLLFLSVFIAFLPLMGFGVRQDVSDVSRYTEETLLVLQGLYQLLVSSLLSVCFITRYPCLNSFY